MMAGGVSGYAAVHSRVRVMYSGLIAQQTGANLRDVADLQGLVALLKNTLYAPYLTSTEDRDITPKWAVHHIRFRLADVYQTIIHAVPPHTRSLAIELFRHFELDNLKAVLRGIVTESPWERVEEILFPLGSFTVLPAQKMLETGNVETAVAQLTETPYYETLIQALKRYSEEQSLFPLEVALDLYYWRKLWSRVGQLPSSDRSQALRVIGALVDMNNLMWALRYRVYHHLSEEEVINYTLPFGYKVRDEDIRAIAAGTDIAHVVERVYPGLSHVDTLLEDPERGLPKLELQLQRRLKQHLQSVFTGYPFHIGLPLAFAVLNELEIQDLIVLIEAKSSQMSVEEFSPYLLMGTSTEESSVA